MSPSAGCGNIICATARQGSGPERSTSASWCLHVGADRICGSPHRKAVDGHRVLWAWGMVPRGGITLIFQAYDFIREFLRDFRTIPAVVPSKPSPTFSNCAASSRRPRLPLSPVHDSRRSRKPYRGVHDRPLSCTHSSSQQRREGRSGSKCRTIRPPPLRVDDKRGKSVRLIKRRA